LTEDEIQRVKENEGKVLYNIGYLYKNKGEYNKAFAWYHKAALTDHVEAQSQMGDMYRWGEGIPVDYKRAMEWYQKAAKNGSMDALSVICHMHRYGESEIKENHNVIECFKKEANQGNTMIQYYLGAIYDTKCEMNDPQKAVYWYQMAFDHGFWPVETELKALNQRGYHATEPKGMEYLLLYDNLIFTFKNINRETKTD
jgi:TPR repeat protein